MDGSLVQVAKYLRFLSKELIFKLGIAIWKGKLLTEVVKVKRATAGFIVSLIGGIIDALVAVLLIAAASWMAEAETLVEFMHRYGHGMAWSLVELQRLLTTLGVIGLILAILVIVGAVLIYMPGKEVIGGILVLVFSIINMFFTLGGFFIGLILGIVGGALGIAKK